MKSYTLPFALAAVLVSASILADEYDYRPTPIADQIDDLQDQDRDGVINARDLCPDTPSTAEVDNDGCGTYIKTSQQMQIRVLFANNSDVINPVFRSQIKELAEFLKLYPSTSIELQGFASRTGNAKLNLELSQRRADNVKEMLISYGISSNRVRIVGFGDSKLANDGDDEVSHALNRRVVASVVGHKGDIKEEWTIFTRLPKSKK
ncbi:membrane protein [Vibrio navarrensis]|uniref:OmpA family protein n=1 Tax=Vibrio navarrensis TaxID=29495 RepID=UPI00052CE2FB|nr:OmpA family protein [Vibrio navarrensis]KGK16150.1 membrane protein [Vibrio navarrensis]